MKYPGDVYTYLPNNGIEWAAVWYDRYTDIRGSYYSVARAEPDVSYFRANRHIRRNAADLSYKHAMALVQHMPFTNQDLRLIWSSE